MENSNLRIKDKLIDLTEFSSHVHRFTLRFKDKNLEKKYPKKSISPFSCTIIFKILSYTSLIFVCLRRLETLLLAFADHPLIVEAKSEELINFTLFAAALALESIVFLTPSFKIMRGFFIMIYIYTSIAYTSYYVDKSLLFSPTAYFFTLILYRGIPFYMLSIVIGVVYASSWVISLSACIVGLIGQITFATITSIAWCKFLLMQLIDEILTHNIAYTIVFSLLSSFFYSIEYKTRYDFFFAHTEEEYHKDYQKLLANMPVGIFIVERKNKEVVFYNKVISKLVRIHNEKLANDSDESDANPITGDDIKDVIKSFKQRKGKGDLGTVLNNWNAEVLDDKHKYKYKKDGHKFVYTVKGLRLPFWSRDSGVFFLEDQTPFEELSKLERRYQKLYVASIVHDIRSPLNGIMGIIENIGMLTKDKKVKGCVDIARKTCQLLSFLTYDITDYSQLKAHKFEPNMNKVKISEVLKEIAELLSFNFKTKGLTCRTVVKDSVPYNVMIDKHRYMQILLNLLTNALKFTFKGSITIKTKYDIFNNQLITSVTDTGIGIKAKDIPHLFKLFGKLESSSSMNPQGVGFGLAMCKKLSERLGGSIGVKSEPGRGSTFTFSMSVNPTNDEAESSNSGMDEKSSSVIEVPKQIADHTFIPHKPTADFKGDKKEFLNSPYRNLLGTMELVSNTPLTAYNRCGCNKVLIVDDDYCNLIVLQSYLQRHNIKADEVFLHKILG